jgi:hypothetical protein
MVVVIGLFARITAVVLAVTSGGTGNSSGTRPLSDNFVTFGQHLTESRRATALRVRRESRQEGKS